LAGTATVTEATWAQIAPLLPKLQGAPKRTRYAHRWVLDGILAVMRSGRSWREGPAGDIPWAILYQRYRLWRTCGAWDAILRILHPEADTSFVT
jgi:transposase